MRQTRVTRSQHFYESIMKMLAAKKLYKEALEIYDESVKDGIEPSAVTMSCLVSFAAEVGNVERASEFFDRLCQMGSPSIRACMTILRVYSKKTDFARSVDLLRKMKKYG